MPSLTEINVAHLHLLLNHVPTIGSVIALALLMLGFVRRDEPLKYLGLEVLFVIAVLTMPVYMTGVAAHQALREVPEVADETIRIHQDAALVAFTVIELAGFVGWVALWQSRRRGRAARGVVALATLLLLASLAIMGRAANLGGEIRHPEIRAALSPADEAAALRAAGGAAPGTAEGSRNDPERFLAGQISQVMVYSTWVWPAAEAVHFLGLCLSLGVLLAVNLRILGAMRRVAFADVHRLLPWGMLGFGANLITGMMFFVGQPGQYLASTPFYWKVILLVFAGANFLYLTVFQRGWARDPAGGGYTFDATLADKVMALSSLVAWFGVLYAGRMLPFLGRAF
jgi:hypothetical protein